MFKVNSVLTLFCCFFLLILTYFTLFSLFLLLQYSLIETKYNYLFNYYNHMFYVIRTFFFVNIFIFWSTISLVHQTSSLNLDDINHQLLLHLIFHSTLFKNISYNLPNATSTVNPPTSPEPFICTNQPQSFKF